MRNVIHTIISLGMWCLFGYYWYVVARRQLNLASLEAVGVLALITLLGLLGTIWWIAHNKNLASKNRRRSAPPTVPETFRNDHLGRPLAGAALETLKRANLIEVSLDGDGTKHYTLPEGVTG